MVITIMQKAGFKFSKKKWPVIKVAELKELGITPTDIGKEFRPATVYQTLGPQWCYGIQLDTGNNKRQLAVR